MMKMLLRLIVCLFVYVELGERKRKRNRESSRENGDGA